MNSPTKAFQPDSYTAHGLQELQLRVFSGNKLLCPVNTIHAYLLATKTQRKNVDNLFILCYVRDPRKVSNPTISRWVKNLMKDAGIANYSASSGRNSSSSSAIFSGIPLDVLFSQVGWGTPNTFINYYMCPLLKEIGDTKVCENDKSKVSQDDPHGFSELWEKNAIRRRPQTKVKTCQVVSVINVQLGKLADEHRKKLRHGNQRVHHYRKCALPVIPPNMLLQSTPLQTASISAQFKQKSKKYWSRVPTLSEVHEGIKGTITTRRKTDNTKKGSDPKVPPGKCANKENTLDSAQNTMTDIETPSGVSQDSLECLDKLPPCIDNMINKVLNEEDNEDILTNIAMGMCSSSPCKSPTVGYGSDFSDEDQLQVGVGVKIIHVDDNTQCISHPTKVGNSAVNGSLGHCNDNHDIEPDSCSNHGNTQAQLVSAIQPAPSVVPSAVITENGTECYIKIFPQTCTDTYCFLYV